MFVDLVLDLVGLVGHEDAGIRVACAHLGLRTLKSREELGVDQSGFGVFQLLGDISSQAEIWVLINCTWNQARDVGNRSKYVRKRVRERRCGLDGCEVNFADVIPDSSSSQRACKANQRIYDTYDSLKPKVAFTWL